MNNSDLEFTKALRRLAGLEKHAIEACKLLSDLYDFRDIASRQAAKVTREKLDEESMRRRVIEKNIRGVGEQFDKDLKSVFRQEIDDIFARLLSEMPRRISNPLTQLKQKLDPSKLESIRFVLSDAMRLLQGYVEFPPAQKCAAISEMLLGLSERLSGFKEQLDATIQQDAEADRTEWDRYQQARKGKGAPRFTTSRSPNETVSQFIDRVCAERGWTIKELAGTAGVNESWIYRLKNGERVWSTNLQVVAHTLGCSVDDLLP